MNRTARDERFPWSRVSNVALAAAAVFAAMALLRFRTWHNDTFDLAFYTRMVWGAGHLDLYDPLVGAPMWGLHLSLVLLPLALLGRVVSIVPLLLITQAAAVAAAGIPLARIAFRRVGHPAAAYVALGVYLLFPTIGSIASYEFHPSSLALLPLALALDFFDQRRAWPGLAALFAAVLCREDVALCAALACVAMALHRPSRALCLAAAAFFFAWFAVYLFVIAPHFLPRTGSLQLHFGHLGSSPAAIVVRLLRHPLATAAELATPGRLLYVPRLLAPVAMISLLRPRWLMPALAPVAINVLSQFPTAVQVHSHYSTLAVPFIVVSAVHGAAWLMAMGGLQAERYGVLAGAVVSLASLQMHHRAGVLPGIGRRFDIRAHRADARQPALDAVVAMIDPDASYTGPDFTLSHFAERTRVFRFKQPPDRAAEFVVLSTEHRALHTGTQELFRNAEEVTVRNAVYWRRYGVWTVVGDYIVLREHWPVRTYAAGRYVDFEPDARVHAAHADVGPSMAVAGWGITPAAHGSRVTLLLQARTPWPYDLGLELGWGPLHPHLDREDPARTYAFLPFDGVFMPPFVRVGEVARTEVDVPASPEELRAHGLWFGARRIDGSRLDADSAHWTRLRE